jgi:hypothetical protein
VPADSRTIPPRYRNGEYSLVRQISTPMMTSPVIPIPSRIQRAASVTSLPRWRLGQTNASAAPMSTAKARVSVPS